MDSRAIRDSFLRFFEQHGHTRVRSSPLVPQSDPTLLFTNAGMVQFKDVFTGKETRAYKRATTCQKCVRAGGKHNDLENVGKTARHHTFFEMLGNFSFGDYFKEDAISFAWEWLTKELKLDPKRMVITVFGGESLLKLGPDDEARKVWRNVTGFSDERIIGLGMADNFWMMGDTGPQGPCSEIHYFLGDTPNLQTFGSEPGPDGTGWMEIWNLVFMQFERKTAKAALEPLPRPSIDTGAGLERLSAVLAGARSNYDTDLLLPLVTSAGELAQKTYRATDADDDISMRVLADHARATAFLLTDGITPSNEGRGYVLRRIMRRAIRHGVRLGLSEGHFRQLCEQVVQQMGTHYPELKDAKALIGRFVDAEDQGFRRTLDRGLRLLQEEIALQSSHKRTQLDGATVFKLYDTYGFPADLTRLIAEEKGFSIDEAGFEAEMAKQRNRSEFAGSSEQAVSDQWKQLRGRLGATQFLGYETTSAECPILWSQTDGTKVSIVAGRTPFYGESGGQIGDTGKIVAADFEVEVVDTQRPLPDFIVHFGKLVRGSVSDGQQAQFTVDAERRNAIRGNHSATHLVHWALRKVLGTHVTQKGSLVAPDRLRFDFSHFGPLSPDEKREIERLVNQEILRNQTTSAVEAGFDEARQMGAMALFGEKYGDRVRVMSIGAESIELCGGTHVARTGDIGLFKITEETGIAQGIRRIEAVSGTGAVAYVQKLEQELFGVAERLKAPAFGLAPHIERLQKDIKERDKRVDDLQRKLAAGNSKDVMSEVREVSGVKLLCSRSEIGDPKALRDVADDLRNKLKSGIVVIGGVSEGKVALVAAVSKDLTDRFHAGKIIAALAERVGGKGGGRPDMAQGGGPDAQKLDEALAAVPSLL